MSSKKKNEKLIIAIVVVVLIVVCILIESVVSRVFYEEIEEIETVETAPSYAVIELKRYATEINERAPVQIDQFVVLEGATINNEMSYFRFHLKFTNIKESEVPIDSFSTLFTQNFTPKAQENLKLEMVKDAGVTVEYKCVDKNGEYVSKLLITPEMYQE